MTTFRHEHLFAIISPYPEQGRHGVHLLAVSLVVAAFVQIRDGIANHSDNPVTGEQIHRFGGPLIHNVTVWGWVEEIEELREIRRTKTLDRISSREQVVGLTPLQCSIAQCEELWDEGGSSSPCSCHMLGSARTGTLEAPRHGAYVAEQNRKIRILANFPNLFTIQLTRGERSLFRRQIT
jgi:hypothetical protein